MAYYNTTVTPQNTGNITINNGFKAEGARITISNSPGTESVMHFTTGTVDSSGYMKYHSIYADSIDRNTVSGTNKIASHYRRVNNNVVEVCAIEFVSFNNTSTTFNVTKADWPYQFQIELFD